jgi:hypothetical protein
MKHKIEYVICGYSCEEYLCFLSPRGACMIFTGSVQCGCKERKTSEQNMSEKNITKGLESSEATTSK